MNEVVDERESSSFIGCTNFAFGFMLTGVETAHGKLPLCTPCPSGIL